MVVDAMRGFRAAHVEPIEYEDGAIIVYRSATLATGANPSTY